MDAVDLLKFFGESWKKIQDLLNNKEAMELIMQNHGACIILGYILDEYQEEIESLTEEAIDNLDILLFSDIGMSVIAESAQILNKIAKDVILREKMFKSPYVNKYFNTIYNTLHNAPTSLFTKYESYWTSELNNNSNIYVSYINQQAWTNTGVPVFLPEKYMQNSILLLKSVRATDNYMTYWFSSQSGDMLYNTGMTTLQTIDKVVPGGVTEYTTYTSYNGRYAACRFANYVAV